MAAVLAQTAVVRFNYLGNGTALFRHGMEFPPPPSLFEQHRLFIFPPGYGYDGQFYHLMAHDPLARGDAPAHMDDPRLRYRRILVPLVAWVIALGRPALIDAVYDIVLLAAVSAGVWALGALARGRGKSAAWGAAFALVPATAISLDRMTPDVALVALTVAMAWAVEEKRRGLPVLLVLLAPLVRETGWLLLIAYALSLAFQRCWRRAGLVVLAGLPALAWYAYVDLRLPSHPYPLLAIPLSGLWSAAAHPPEAAGPQALAAPLMRAAGLLALAGMLLAFAWAAVLARRHPASPLALTAVLFALTGVFLQRADHWQAAHDYARVYSPLLAVLLLDGLVRASPWPLLPLLCVWPRLALEMRGEVLVVLRGIF